MLTVTVSARWAHYVETHVQSVIDRIAELPDWAADPWEPGSIEITVRRVPAVGKKEAA